MSEINNENKNSKVENSSCSVNKISETEPKNKLSISFFSLRISFYLLVISISIYALKGNHDKGTRMAKIKSFYYDKILTPSYNFFCNGDLESENSTHQNFLNKLCKTYGQLFSLDKKRKSKKKKDVKNIDQQRYKLNYKNKIAEHIARQNNKKSVKEDETR